MQAKLTLRIDEKSIIFAKMYSKETQQSISKIVESYFMGLATMTKSESLIENLPPLVRTLRGCLIGTNVTEQDYKKYLEDKYK
jgi:hypothetical protein